MDLRLVVLSSGQQEGAIIRVPRLPFVIGRDPLCELRPRSVLVSRRHCAILEREGKLVAEDLGSSNGTFVNEQRIQGAKELKHGDRLKVGPLMLGIRLEAAVLQESSPGPDDAPTVALGRVAGTDTPVDPAAPPRVSTGPTQMDIHLPRLDTSGQPPKPDAGAPSTQESPESPTPLEKNPPNQTTKDNGS